MGFTRVPNRLWAAGVSGAAKLTYVAIASHAHGSKTTAWPSQARLATMTGYCERSIRRFTRELETAGLVRVERRRGRASVYSIVTADRESATAADPGHDVRQPRTESPAAPDPKSAEEEQGSRPSEEDTPREEESFSPDGDSGVDGPGVAFDPRDPDSWKLVPDHFREKILGDWLVDGEDPAPVVRGRKQSPVEYWWHRERDLRQRTGELRAALGTSA
jgi:hypothetical protein